MDNPFFTTTDSPFIPPMPPGHPDNPSTYTGRETYVLYYKYQRRFTTWLAKAAASVGEKVQGSTSENSAEIVIPFHELPRLAKAVARRGTVPQQIIYYINYMLALRGEWDVRNEKKAIQDNYYRNIIHTQAITNLLSVREAFKSATIEQEEPEDPRRTNRITHVLPELPGEAFFAWVCFFNDLFTIRAYLRCIWHQYQQSLETLTTATLVTNMAIKMIRRSCENLIQITGHLHDMPPESKITEWIHRGITGELFLPGQFFHDSWQNYEASWCCYEAELALQHCSLEFSHAHQILMPHNEDYWRTFKKGFGTWPNHGYERHCQVGEYIRLLCHSLHNLKIFLKVGIDKYDPAFLRCYDEITNGWLKWKPYLNFQRIPLWLVISFQILVDIREELGPYSPTALDDLEDYAHDTDVIFRKNLQRAITDKKMKQNSKHAGDCSDLIRNIQNRMQKDNFHEVPSITVREKQGRQSNLFLLKTNVLLCGMQSWMMERAHVRLADSTVKIHESIMPAALLYLAMRKAGLIGMWHDMELVLQIRGFEIISYAKGYWGPCYCPEDATLFDTLKSYFIDIDKPPGLRKVFLGSRYFYNLFMCYGWQRTYWIQSGVPAPVMRLLVDRVYHREDWKFWIKDDVCSTYPPNVLVSLYVVATACHLDEELAFFDWHSMHDTCQEFFDNLRQTLGDLCFSEFGSESRSPPPSTAGPPDLDDSDTGDSDSNVFDSNEGPTPGSVTPPSSIHSLGMVSDDPISLEALEALYYLIFADDPERRQENMILAALCLDASEISNCKIPDREWLTETWADDIAEHAEELGLSLLLARDVLYHYISDKRDIHMSNSAVRLWKRHRLRAEIPKGASDALKNFLNKRWLHNGPPLHRNATEAHKPETWDRYEEWYRGYNEKPSSRRATSRANL
ncbi:hypothetical protein F4679DRAFT_592578 [Xylaria curta]|nr:hypothetical protein F4679DRAFT_592578 [Xylaria curta]